MTQRATRKRWRRGVLRAALLVGLLTLRVAHGQNIVLASSNEVRERWEAARGTESDANFIEARLDGYRSDARGGVVNTAIVSGNQYRLALQADGRFSAARGEAHYSAAFTQSNDPSVNARSRGVLGSMQLGWAGGSQSWLAGDVQPGFSKLTDAAGLRGLLGEIGIGPARLAAVVGTVANSWEELSGQVVRTSALRDSAGTRLELALSPSLSGYATWQQFEDRSGALPQIDGGQPLRGRAGSLGFAYEARQRALHAEYARSRSYGADRVGKGAAATLGGHLQYADGTVRLGLHRMQRGFTALAPAAEPGSDEGHIGVDHRLTAGVAVNAEARQGAQWISQIDEQAQAFWTRQRSRSLTLGGTWSLAGRFEGLALQLRSYGAWQDAGDLLPAVRQRHDSAGLSFAQHGWSSGLTLARLLVRNDLAESLDDTTDSANLNLGYARFAGPRELGATINLSLGVQRQQQMSELANRGNTLQLSAQLQRESIWAIDAQASVTRLRQDGFGIEVTQATGAIEATWWLQPGISATVFGRLEQATATTAEQEFRATQLGLRMTGRF